MASESKSLVLLGLLGLLWGSYFLMIQFADESTPPMVIATVRLTSGAIVLYVVLKLKGLKLPPVGRQWLPFVIIGLFEALLTTILIATGERHISSALAAVLFGTMPIFTVLLGYVWLRRPLTPAKILGVSIGFVGTVIVLLPSLEQGAGSGLLLLGAISVLLASLAKAFAALYSHQVLLTNDPIVVATGMMFSAAIIGLPLTLLLENPTEITLTMDSILALIGMSITTPLGFLIFFWLVKFRGAAFASTVRFIEPPVAIVLGGIFVGGTLQLSTLVGMAAIMLCVAIMNGQFDRWIGIKQPST